MRPVEITEFGINMETGDMDGEIRCPYPSCNKTFPFIIKGEKLKEMVDAWKNR